MKRLILASVAIAAMASCSKESDMDVAITSVKVPIKYTTYAGSATTKGTPINSNSEFAKAGSAFEVSAYAKLDGATTVGKYFGFSTVSHDGTSWNNTDNTYWPNANATLYMGAHTASSRLTNSNYVCEASNLSHKLSFDYIVNGDVYSSSDADAPTASTVDAHEDLMFAVTENIYKKPTKDESNNDATVDSDMKVNLHFKHALSQIAFSATKEDDIDVSVRSITVCNVMSSGSLISSSVTDADPTIDGDDDDNTLADGFVSTGMCSWGTSSLGNIAHYKPVMNFDLEAVTPQTEIVVDEGDDVTLLTSQTNAMMLIPQALTAWEYTDSNDDSKTGLDGELATVESTNSYLAIDCTIKHAGADVAIVDGVIFIPFSTDGIKYKAPYGAVNYWKSGYKITYKLHFGGGYTDPTPNPDKPGPEIPEPGETPDPDDLVPTLRAVTYTTSVDAWETSYGSPSVDLDDID